MENEWNFPSFPPSLLILNPHNYADPNCCSITLIFLMLYANLGFQEITVILHAKRTNEKNKTTNEKRDIYIYPRARFPTSVTSKKKKKKKTNNYSLRNSNIRPALFHRFPLHLDRFADHTVTSTRHCRPAENLLPFTFCLAYTSFPCDYLPDLSSEPC